MAIVQTIDDEQILIIRYYIDLHTKQCDMMTFQTEFQIDHCGRHGPKFSTHLLPI
jgi:hypothetical protein